MALQLLRAIFALASHVWMASVGFVILGALAFALSHVFNLLGELFSLIQRPDERTNLASVKEKLGES